MAKASRVLAALKRDGWVVVRQRGGSHTIVRRDGRQVTWSFHDGEDLGNPAMAKVAKEYGYTLEELRKLL